MRLCELRDKEVINVVDCRCLGNVLDLEFDECTGCIRALVVSGQGKMFGLFCHENELVIKWCQIVRIGPDIVLVDLPKDDHPRQKR